MPSRLRVPFRACLGKKILRFALNDNIFTSPAKTIIYTKAKTPPGGGAKIIYTKAKTPPGGGAKIILFMIYFTQILE